MLLLRWCKSMGQSILMFVVAGALAVLLLHLQAGWTMRVDGPRLQPERWLSATGAYLRRLAEGDLGTLQPLRQVPGYTQPKPVGSILATQGSRSLALLGAALVLSLGMGTLAGLLGSRFGPTWLRSAALSATVLLFSTPDLLLVLLMRRLAVWAIGTLGVQVLKVGALTNPGPWDYLVPALTLAAVPLAITARVAAVAFDEVHGELYIRTARSKGLSALRVVWSHVLRNVWVKVLDAAPLVLGALASGLVVVEYVLYFPGVGRLLGLVLEGRAQPGAASSIVLALLLATLLVQAVLAAIRLSLDRRLAGREGGMERPQTAPVPWGVALRETMANLRELPYQFSQVLWAWRPGVWLRELGSNRPLLLGTLGVAALTAIAVFGGHMANVEAIHKVPRYLIHEGKPFFPPFKPGTPGYPLGSDIAGRDLLARLVVGARYTLFFALAVTPIRFLVALPWGLLAGFRGRGWAGSSRTLGLLFSAIPLVLIPVALLPPEMPLSIRERVSGTDSGLFFWRITLILAVAGIPRLTESVRQQVETTLVQPFVEGAAAAGAGAGRILRRHLLPHLAPQLWAIAAADVAWTLLLLAQLGLFSIFLGGSIFVMTGTEVLENSSGIAVPRIPDWSSMLARPYDVIYRAPWALWYPAAAFLLAVVIFNLLAEGLRRRAQRFVARPGAPVDETGKVPAPARRRLSLEWGAALLILLTVSGAAVRYGFASAAVWYTEVASTPLARNRQAMQLLLDEIQGSADSVTRSKAAAQLRRVVSLYLAEAHKAGYTLVQIQEDARGQVDTFEAGGLRIVSVFVPGAPKGGYIFVQDLSNGQVSFMNTEERPNTVAVIGSGQARRIFLAGTVPGPDTWALSIWYGPIETPGLGFDTSGYVQDGSLAQQLFSQISPEFGASLPMDGSRPQGRIVTTKGAFNSLRVAPAGDVEICLDRGGPCQDVRWTGRGFARP